jgi:NAD(P)-dependent dehydrogenase (short-subunit alcohol dehydrogenase family)
MAASDQAKIDSGFAMKSEAAEVMAGIDLSGKVAVVTGGYSGIGVETTRALINAGAKVHVPVRNPEKAAETLADIDGQVHIGEMDLSDLDSVIAYAESISSMEPKLDLLINNAGIMACPETRVGSDWESQFAVNHLGHFVLTTHLLSNLLEADNPRVVCLSSIAHKRSDIRWDDIHFEKDPYEK